MRIKRKNKQDKDSDNEIDYSELENYIRDLAVFLGLKANRAFFQFELNTTQTFDIELTLTIPYIIDLVESKGNFKHKFNESLNRIQKELQERIIEAKELIVPEIVHMKELHEEHGINWKDIHQKEIKHFLRKIKEINQSYI